MTPNPRSHPRDAQKLPLIFARQGREHEARAPAHKRRILMLNLKINALRVIRGGPPSPPSTPRRPNAAPATTHVCAASDEIIPVSGVEREQKSPGCITSQLINWKSRDWHCSKCDRERSAMRRESLLISMRDFFSTLAGVGRILCNGTWLGEFEKILTTS